MENKQNKQGEQEQPANMPIKTGEIRDDLGRLGIAFENIIRGKNATISFSESKIDFIINIYGKDMKGLYLKGGGFMLFDPDERLTAELRKSIGGESFVYNLKNDLPVKVWLTAEKEAAFEKQLRIKEADGVIKNIEKGTKVRVSG